MQIHGHTDHSCTTVHSHSSLREVAVGARRANSSAHASDILQGAAACISTKWTLRYLSSYRFQPQNYLKRSHIRPGWKIFAKGSRTCVGVCVCVRACVQYGFVFRRFVLRRFTFTTLLESQQALLTSRASLSQLERPFYSQCGFSSFSVCMCFLFL